MFILISLKRSFLTSFSQTTKIMLCVKFLIMEWFTNIFDDLCWNRHADWMIVAAFYLPSQDGAVLPSVSTQYNFD